VAYISPIQINALVPSDVTVGPQPLVVGLSGLTSVPYSIAVKLTDPQLWAPSPFNIGGKQYVGAVFPDFSTFVLPVGGIPGVPSRPAGPGDTIILLGIGFGGVTPNVPAGQVVTQSTQLNTPVQFVLGQTAVTPTFAGLEPNETGLYQFDVQIPAGVPAGDVPLLMTISGVSVPQTPTLWIALSPLPTLQVSGVTDLAGNSAIAVPGGMILVQGSGFAAAPTPASYPLPTALGSIQATFDGFAAPIAGATPQQLQVQVPWELLGRSSTTLTIANTATGTTASIPLTVQTAQPGIALPAAGFTMQIEGSGGASPAPISPGSKNRPIIPGEFLDIPASGLGLQTDGP